LSHHAGEKEATEEEDTVEIHCGLYASS